MRRGESTGERESFVKHTLVLYSMLEMQNHRKRIPKGKFTSAPSALPSCIRHIDLFDSIFILCYDVVKPTKYQIIH